MDIKAILSQLKAERDRLDKAIAALEGLESSGTSRGRGRRRGRRRMSAAGRKRISEMMKARWAARRKATKK